MNNNNYTRRNIAKTAAWSTPAIAAAIATPARAASTYSIGNAIPKSFAAAGSADICFPITVSGNPAATTVTFDYIGSTNIVITSGHQTANITKDSTQACTNVTYDGGGTGTTLNGTVTATLATGGSAVGAITATSYTLTNATTATKVPSRWQTTSGLNTICYTLAGSPGTGTITFTSSNSSTPIYSQHASQTVSGAGTYCTTVDLTATSVQNTTITANYTPSGGATKTATWTGTIGAAGFAIDHYNTALSFRRFRGNTSAPWNVGNPAKNTVYKFNYALLNTNGIAGTDYVVGETFTISGDTVAMGLATSYTTTSAGSTQGYEISTTTATTSTPGTYSIVAKYLGIELTVNNLVVS